MTVAEHVAEWMASHGMRHVFGIVGAGNCALFDAISKNGYTQIVCHHHEQAAVMAANAYYRASGTVTCAVLTTGGGAANGFTGAVGAHMDSIPVIILSGNEKSTATVDGRRAWGVQGFDVVKCVESVTKHAFRAIHPEKVVAQLEFAYWAATGGRPGPAWVDVPMDVQRMEVAEMAIPGRVQEVPPDLSVQADLLAEEIGRAKRPVFWLGNGIRLAGGASLVDKLLSEFKVPTILSWSAVDLVDSDHPMVFGRAGVYGQRCANFVVQNADLIVAIGTRLAVPQTGYDLAKFAPEAKLIICDVDEAELKRWHGSPRGVITIEADARYLIEALLSAAGASASKEWIEQCFHWKIEYPWIEKKTHPTSKKMNSYRFIDELQKHLAENAIVVTDMGASLLSAHQALKIKPPQRLFTSQGLGEMGCGLPMAIGAQVACPNRQVVCLTTDGGMMFNVQELSTMIQNSLPIKIVVFDNRGYGMIKASQDAYYKHRVGVDASSGVSFPEFRGVFAVFAPYHPCWETRNLEALANLGSFLSHTGPAMLVVHMDPEQKYLPKVIPQIGEDGSIVNPGLEDMSPPLPRAQLAKEMG